MLTGRQLLGLLRPMSRTSEVPPRLRIDTHRRRHARAEPHQRAAQRAPAHDELCRRTLEGGIPDFRRRRLFRAETCRINPPGSLHWK